MTHRPDQATGPDGTFTWLGLSAMCTSKRWGRVERYDALHPEKPWFDTEGRGFDSRHLHVMGPVRWTSSTEQGPCFCRGNDPRAPGVRSLVLAPGGSLWLGRSVPCSSVASWGGGRLGRIPSGPRPALVAGVCGSEGVEGSA